MRIGNVVRRDADNTHLDEEFIEIYPNGDETDIAIMRKIPKGDKTATHLEVPTGPTPILVRLRYYQAHIGSFKESTA